ncbi:MAG: hypothetical protein IJ999_05270 [Clostridia bacterium]|nr:hypothetical protein [Clostridia bacterium]
MKLMLGYVDGASSNLLGVVLAFFIVAFVFIIFIPKIKSYKKAIAALCVALGDEEIAEIFEMAKNAEQIEKEMANGVIKEYENKKRKITSQFDAEIKRINAIYSAESNRIQAEANALRSQATRDGTVMHVSSSINQSASAEKQAVNAEKRAQIEPLKKEKERLLKELKQEYQPDLDDYRKVKGLKSGSSTLVKLINKEIKKQSK